MTTQKDFTGATLTVSGAAVRNVKFNSAANMYLGQVWDAQSYREDKWTSASWKKNGKCVNSLRADLNLSYPSLASAEAAM